MSEMKTTLQIGNHVVSIRVLRPSDIALEQRFVERLSSETKHFRFFCVFKELSRDEARRLCDVDGRSSMAMVATIGMPDLETAVGVARYAPDADPLRREMAVTVADDWQHTRLAHELLTHLVKWAKRQGVRQLYALELTENHAMHAIARDFGMKSTLDANDATQVVYSLAI